VRPWGRAEALAWHPPDGRRRAARSAAPVVRRADAEEPGSAPFPRQRRARVPPRCRRVVALARWVERVERRRSAAPAAPRLAGPPCRPVEAPAWMRRMRRSRVWRPVLSPLPEPARAPPRAVLRSARPGRKRPPAGKPGRVSDRGPAGASGRPAPAGTVLPPAAALRPPHGAPGPMAVRPRGSRADGGSRSSGERGGHPARFPDGTRRPPRRVAAPLLVPAPPRVPAPRHVPAAGRVPAPRRAPVPPAPPAPARSRRAPARPGESDRHGTAGRGAAGARPAPRAPPSRRAAAPPVDAAGRSAGSVARGVPPSPPSPVWPSAYPGTRPSWASSSDSSAAVLPSALKSGPVHFTGYALAKFQRSISFPSGLYITTDMFLGLIFP
jgi:hypothetical protein